MVLQFRDFERFRVKGSWLTGAGDVDIGVGVGVDDDDELLAVLPMTMMG